jgi:hypothetical protein
MSLIKKVDVKRHFAERRLRERQQHGAVSQPDATGFSGEETGRSETAVGEPPAQPAVPDPGISSAQIPGDPARV